ncbi:hypothetical protein XELAEV_18019178mg [Xenopus laevis]|uniref:Histidine N-acetyltransferase C-terminal domain-containing protein n=1 Tax=Xenopus laevis TaxID=8355 RepID=A0A974DF24_XENLA|nr:hypothetical protein XELAEV_18019178mg [Xenopus laevis]
MCDFYFLDLQFLPATASDYNEIMSISGGTHDGVDYLKEKKKIAKSANLQNLDYLPFRYHEWLAEPQRRMCVARSEEKVHCLLGEYDNDFYASILFRIPVLIMHILSFASFLLADGGVTVVLQGLCVAPWMRGRCCLNAPANTDLKKTTKLLSCRLQNVYQGRPPVLPNLSEVLSLFDDPISTEVLFPKGIFIQDLLPLTTKKCNIELWVHWGVPWIYSKPSDQTSISAVAQSNSSSSSNLSEHPTLCCTYSGFLSLSNPLFPVPLAKGMYRLNIDLFGTNPNFAQAHILHHLTEAVRVLPPGVVLSALCLLKRT